MFRHRHGHICSRPVIFLHRPNPMLSSCWWLSDGYRSRAHTEILLTNLRHCQKFVVRLFLVIMSLNWTCHVTHSNIHAQNNFTRWGFRLCWKSYKHFVILELVFFFFLFTNNHIPSWGIIPKEDFMAVSFLNHFSFQTFCPIFFSEQL